MRMKRQEATITMSATKTVKAHYTESEAAAVLGIPVEKLRSLVRDHILKGEPECGMLTRACYQPADLLVLRLLAAGAINPTTEN